MIRAIGGDFEAFSSLVGTSTARQYAIATLILRDADRAQDAVQEALVAAWKGLSALRDPDAWDAWLHRLTVRACYHAAKRDRRRSLVELSVAARAETHLPDTSFHQICRRSGSHGRPETSHDARLYMTRRLAGHDHAQFG